MLTKLAFEILCVDTQSKTQIKTERGFLHFFMSLESIWQTPEISKEQIIDKASGLTLKVSKINNESNDEDLKNIYQLIFTGSISDLEPIREKILAYINKQGFTNTYILKDDVSKEISRQLYPLINEVETSLRKYLMRFFITKLGPNWWNITADSEMKNKTASGRSKNEKVFAPYIDNKIYLIDFNDLGKMVYSQSSGFVSKDEIVDKIHKLEETPEAIKRLKKDLESNYNKFFKENFKDKLFQQKWEIMEQIRHKVAHNNLFIDNDLQTGKKTADELINIIEEANNKIQDIDFSIDEIEAIEAIKDEILDSYSHKVVTEENFIKALLDLEEWASRGVGSYVSVGKLIKEVLGQQGFDYRASNDIMNQLIQNRKVETYEHPTLNKTCIRIVK